MANAFKSVTSPDVTALTTVHTSVAQTVVIGFSLANKGVSEATVNVTVAGVHLLKDVPIHVGSTLSPISGKIVLENTETITVESTIAVDAILALLEIT